MLLLLFGIALIKRFDGIKSEEKHFTSLVSWKVNFSRRDSKLYPFIITDNFSDIRRNFSLSSGKKFCFDLMNHYGILPGKKWGLLRDRDLMSKWKMQDCPGIIEFGRVRTCDEVIGYKFMHQWKANEYLLCRRAGNSSNTSSYGGFGGGSRIRQGDHVCRQAPFAPFNIQCSFSSLKIDFKKSNLSEKKSLRMFYPGFTSVNCDQGEMPENFRVIFDRFFPGFELNNGSFSSTNNGVDDVCDVRVTQPTLVACFDHVGNLGHLFEDVINHWLSSELAGVDRKKTLFVNIQGLRDRTVERGYGRHVQNRTHPDDIGFYRPIFDVLFGAVAIPSTDWVDKVVCFENGLHTYNMPLKGFLWENFGNTDRCAITESPSYLYQKFQSDYMTSWSEKSEFRNGLKNLVEYFIAKAASNQPLLMSNVFLFSKPTINNSPAYDYNISSGGYHYDNGPATTPSIFHRDNNIIRILLVLRRAVSPTMHFASRVMANSEDVIQSLQNVLKTFRKRQRHVDTQLVIADFASMNDFVSQVILSHSISIMIGFHGAGINHMFHMTPGGRKYCCGLIELFPEMKTQFVGRVGHGNYARLLGFHYLPFYADNGSYVVERNGTVLRADLLAKRLRIMLRLLLSKPCSTNVVGQPRSI